MFGKQGDVNGKTKCAFRPDEMRIWFGQYALLFSRYCMSGKCLSLGLRKLFFLCAVLLFCEKVLTLHSKNAAIAQLVERWLPKPKVAGSSPVCRSCL